MERKITPLRAAAARRGWTTSQLAAELGCAPSHASHLLAGRRISKVLRARLAGLGFTEAEMATEPTVDPLDASRALLVDATSAGAASRLAQGLSPQVEDQAVLDAVARLLADALFPQPQPQRGGGPR
jgi:transcriptional regulator with XRE-family HTH domain